MHGCNIRLARKSAGINQSLCNIANARNGLVTGEIN
ncbi:hypothetical protein NX02_16800 [Sphingomonas sanxanigenens DSM 19645 = NX02]|uniref:Uncharacterized protein n=1 Tax=Sphingomonas sanxanigenens DSM 19645 = NX02 TaxID=1123269 RepID=W0AFK0_9SPHN|nr:hypothetical protein NX02_16800 [Sphingomonas sanxanigenens DSM 19645 = NX02]